METDAQGALAKGKMVLACGGGAWGTAESAVRRPLDRGLCGYDSEGDWRQGGALSCAGK